MASPKKEKFKELDAFAVPVGAEEINSDFQTPSESSSVSMILNAMSSLTCNETSSRDHAGLHNLYKPLIQKNLKNIQPTSSRVGSMSKNKLEEGVNNATGLTPEIHQELLAKLSLQNSVLKDQGATMAGISDSSTGSSARRTSPVSADAASNNDGRTLSSSSASTDEVERLKKELNAANERLAKQDEELNKTRDINHGYQQPSRIANMDIFNRNSHRGVPIRHDLLDDARSDVSIAASSFSRGINAWDSVSQAGITPAQQQQQQNIWSMGANKTWNNRGVSTFPQTIMPQPAARNYPGAVGAQISPETSPFLAPSNPFQLGNAGRSRTAIRSRGRTVANPWSPFWASGSSPEGSAITAMNNMSYQPVGTFQTPSVFTPAPSTLSAMAPEFTLGNNDQANYVAALSAGQSYVPPVEPLNYRKLLDRNVSCNWKYIVDKIVCNNDQQASIFLQQKLKVGTAEQKYEIVQAIVAQAFPLMINRFGNFLVQRCFEHGTPEQVNAIAGAIRGNTLTLSMDAFGCHVVQKAFDAVSEDFKAVMVHELLRRIPETVIHRYACHVWQKLFELRWSDSPPQIMKYVNDALRGMWYDVALGETGSLVVQNIFENCLEEDKRPCIDEVLNSIDIVAHGQFGNWCIQHICEHGAPADRNRAIDHILRYATEYSMDQYASKVVEKCLKIGGNEFLDRYLERVCEGRPNRPRIPLIDIASDQYGNYLIQHILTNASAQHRELVAAHIRKHMVSLRGSKFGSRVGLLCCNPSYATRPTPTVTASTSRFLGSNNVVPTSAPVTNTGARYGSGTLP